jgi:hypothetical protein
MDLNDLFDGDAVMGVPTAQAVYLDKSEGAQDAQGDHCVS